MSSSNNPPPPPSAVFVRRQKVAQPPAPSDPLDILRDVSQTRVSQTHDARPTSRHASRADDPLPPPPLLLRTAASAIASSSQALANCFASRNDAGDAPLNRANQSISLAAAAPSKPNDLLQVPPPALRLPSSSHNCRPPPSLTMRRWACCRQLAICVTICPIPHHIPARMPSAAAPLPVTARAPVARCSRTYPLLLQRLLPHLLPPPMCLFLACRR
jgi:hypothetical protein